MYKSFSDVSEDDIVGLAKDLNGATIREIFDLIAEDKSSIDPLTEEEFIQTREGNKRRAAGEDVVHAIQDSATVDSEQDAVLPEASVDTTSDLPEQVQEPAPVVSEQSETSSEAQANVIRQLSEEVYLNRPAWYRRYWDSAYEFYQRHPQEVNAGGLFVGGAFAGFTLREVNIILAKKYESWPFFRDAAIARQLREQERADAKKPFYKRGSFWKGAAKIGVDAFFKYLNYKLKAKKISKK